MKTTNLSYSEAEIAMEQGLCVTLPEWGGYWFRMPEGIKAMTIPSHIAKAWTDRKELTDRKDWRIVNGLMSTGESITALKHGFAVRRSSWSKDEYVFIRPADTLDRSIIGVVKSLPAMVKALLYRDFKSVEFKEYLCKANGASIANGWLPNTEELLAEDWVIATDVR